MPTKVTQINLDGTTAHDYDPDQVPFEEQEDIIRAGLQQRGWSVTFLQADKASRRRLIKIEKGGASIEIITYIFSNLAWSSGNRSIDEKRIQLSRPYSEHSSDFVLPKDGSPRCALMGIYRRKGLIIFCAWDAGAYVDHSNPSSCYVRTNAMVAAARSGIGQAPDAKKRLVFCFTPDMLAYYLSNMGKLHDQVMASNELFLPAPEENKSTASGTKITIPENEIDVNLPRNRIFYGAPGTGKSHNLGLDLTKFFPDDALVERTTFYPDTTSGTFIGAYRPTPIYRSSEGDFFGADKSSQIASFEPIIDYQCEPGPFLRVLGKALSNPDHNFCLVIEEINRANASAVFAEAFQLLDRDEEGNGRYTVTLAAESQTYLKSLGHNGPVRIPSNMYLWATMNSADQGVLPLDSAFKRRWTMEYVGLNDGEEFVKDWEIHLPFLNEAIKWNKFRNVINTHLALQGVAEDRLIGPFFMTPKDLTRKGSFESKILQYLRDDVLRHAPNKLFRDSPSIGSLIAAYRAGDNIFVPDLKFDGA